MDYDGLLPEVGAFGRYQRILIGVVLIPTVFPCAFQAYSQLFIAASMRHWCRIPELDKWNANYTALVRQLSIPATIQDDGQIKFDQCRMFNRNYTEISSSFLDYVSGGRNLSSNPDYVQCRNGWHYDKTLYVGTVVSEFDLVCEKNFYSTFALVIFGAGGLIGNYVFGYLQDHWGRKPSYFAYLFLQISAGFLGAFSWNFESWLFFRTVVGLTIPAILSSPYVIAIELVDPTKRSFCTIVLNIAYSAGLILLAVVVFFVRDWRYLSVAVSLPFVLLFLCQSLIPESPRWLMAVRKYGKARKVLQKIALANGKVLTKDFESAFTGLRKKSDGQMSNSASSYGILDLFRTPNIRKKTLVITFIWFANTSTYVGLSYYAPALGGNEILNFLLAGLVELPTYLFLLPSLHYFGRRWILGLSMLIGGLSCLATFHFQGDQRATLVLYCIGKMGISSAFVVLPLIASEVYPTVIRGIGMSFSSVVAMIGPVLIPIVNYMGSDMVVLPLLVNGVILTLGGLLSLLLPETKNKPLPQTIADGEYRAKNQIPNNFDFELTALARASQSAA